MAFRRSRVRIPSAPPEYGREGRESRDSRPFSFGRNILVSPPEGNPFFVTQLQIILNFTGISLPKQVFAMASNWTSKTSSVSKCETSDSPGARVADVQVCCCEASGIDIVVLATHPADTIHEHKYFLARTAEERTLEKQFFISAVLEISARVCPCIWS
jgi:hypothetical protein